MGTLRDECLNGEIFYVAPRGPANRVEKWRVEYNDQAAALGARATSRQRREFATQRAAIRSPTAACEPPFRRGPNEVVM